MKLSLHELTNIGKGKNINEERYQRDRTMFLAGRQGYPTGPSENFSERDRGCYMMGFNVSSWENNNVF